MTQPSELIWKEISSLQEKCRETFQFYKFMRLSESGCAVGDVVKDACGKIFKISGWHVHGGEQVLKEAGHISGYPLLKNGKFGTTEMHVYTPVTVIKHAGQ